MPVCNFGDSFDVGDVAVRVAEGLCIDHFCIGLDGGFERSKVIHVYDGVCNSLSCKGMRNQVE